MNQISPLLSSFVDEYKQEHQTQDVIYENSLVGDIKKISDKLLDERFLPSLQLKQILDKQIRRARYPIEVAITGQFSSGKSTFLNALLSKDILPTGITPVTSKVNFINYGEEYKLKITYHSGAQEYHSIENISKYTDQRVQNIDNIKYLTIYAPMEILKDISFVDTPGLNSQSLHDTQTTKNILRDVGGIIWLSMMDNAGKLSEKEILDEYMPQFKTKSLCVLNQKDKFTEEQINTTQKYVEDKFSNYFVQVTAISSKMALDGRVDEQSTQIDNSIESLIKKFSRNIKENVNENNLEFFSKDFSTFQKEIHKIKEQDISQNAQLIKESNIQEVLEFINTVMRPNANRSKEIAIKKDIKNMCGILSNEYQAMIAVYTSLKTILGSQEEPTLLAFDEINRQYSLELEKIYKYIEEILQKIAQEIYENINEQMSERYESSKALFSQKHKFEKFDYSTFYIDSDTIFKNLFYDNDRLKKMLKRSMKLLQTVEDDINTAFESIYFNIEKKVVSWQSRYELIKKNREISSDLEFANIRKFASQTHENILNSYHIAMLQDIGSLKEKNAHFNALLSYSNEQKVQATLMYFEQQIQQSQELHTSDPSRFNIQRPSEDEILHKLKDSYSFHMIEEFLNTKRNYLFKVIKASKENYEAINKGKKEFLDERVKPYEKKLIVLGDIKVSIK